MDQVLIKSQCYRENSKTSLELETTIQRRVFSQIPVFPDLGHLCLEGTFHIAQAKISKIFPLRVLKMGQCRKAIPLIIKKKARIQTQCLINKISLYLTPCITNNNKEIHKFVIQCQWVPLSIFPFYLFQEK